MTDDPSLRLAVLETFVKDHFESSEKSVTAALAAAERAISKAELQQRDHNVEQNEWRAALTDQGNRMMSRTESIASLDSVVERLEGELESLRDRLAAHDAPDYLLWGVVVTALVGLTVGMWTVIGLKIDQATAPMAIQLAHLVAEHPAECPVLHPPGRLP